MYGRKKKDRQRLFATATVLPPARDKDPCGLGSLQTHSDEAWFRTFADLFRIGSGNAKGLVTVGRLLVRAAGAYPAKR